MHLHEVAEEVRRWKDMTGYTPIQYYYNKGINILNPNLVAVHCVWLDNKDIKILKETGANLTSSHAEACEVPAS